VLRELASLQIYWLEEKQIALYVLFRMEMRQSWVSGVVRSDILSQRWSNWRILVASMRSLAKHYKICARNNSDLFVTLDVSLLASSAPITGLAMTLTEFP
jgi:hypothetical protein